MKQSDHAGRYKS